MSLQRVFAFIHFVIFLAFGCIHFIMVLGIGFIFLLLGVVFIVIFGVDRFCSWIRYKIEKAHREEFELERMRRHASVIRDVNEFNQLIESRYANTLQQMEPDILYLMNREFFAPSIQAAPYDVNWKKEGF